VITVGRQRKCISQYSNNQYLQLLFKEEPRTLSSYTVQSELLDIPPVVLGCSVAVSRHSTAALHTLRGGGAGQVLDIDELVGDAYDWCNNLGAPAALVAGAVIATLYENFRGGQLELHPGDTPYVMAAKKLTNMLLLSAFAMQIVSIFVTTVMGGVLRSYDYSSTTSTATSGLAFLQEQYEFEFLTSRLSFLQGLIHWLAGVALEYTIPRKGEGQAAKKMDHFIAISLATLIVLLLSFYNSHLTFYPNYFQMLLRWVHVTAIRYFETFQPLMILYIPGILLSCYAGFLALREGAPSEERDD
jgi:hypothetical protein